MKSGLGTQLQRTRSLKEIGSNPGAETLREDSHHANDSIFSKPVHSGGSGDTLTRPSRMSISRLLGHTSSMIYLLKSSLSSLYEQGLFVLSIPTLAGRCTRATLSSSSYRANAPRG